MYIYIHTYTSSKSRYIRTHILQISTSMASIIGVCMRRRCDEDEDISLSARILAAVPERLGAAQRVEDDLQELGSLAKHPAANIIKRLGAVDLDLWPFKSHIELFLSFQVAFRLHFRGLQALGYRF